MKKIIDIGDSFLTPNHQLVLGGTNKLLNNMTTDEIQKMIGEKIILKRPGLNNILLHVVNIKTANSIIDQKNIFILISDKLVPSDIIPGSQIYVNE